MHLILTVNQINYYYTILLFFKYTLFPSLNFGKKKTVILLDKLMRTTFSYLFIELK